VDCTTRPPSENPAFDVVPDGLPARLPGTAPEVADPVGSLEVGEHEDVKQLGAGSGAEGVRRARRWRSSSSGLTTAGYALEPSARVLTWPATYSDEHWRHHGVRFWYQVMEAADDEQQLGRGEILALVRLGDRDRWHLHGVVFRQRCRYGRFLGRTVRDGPKRGTASLLSTYQDDDEPLPKVGDLSVVLGGGGEPICVIRTVSVEVRRFAQVDERFAWIEGEGDRSLEYWRAEHVRFFEAEGRPVDDDTPVVLETFELLWP
jgi:uncharacterized protein YhfF